MIVPRAESKRQPPSDIVFDTSHGGKGAPDGQSPNPAIKRGDDIGLLGLDKNNSIENSDVSAASTPADVNWLSTRAPPPMLGTDTPCRLALHDTAPVVDVVKLPIKNRPEKSRACVGGEVGT